MSNEDPCWCELVEFQVGDDCHNTLSGSGGRDKMESGETSRMSLCGSFGGWDAGRSKLIHAVIIGTLFSSASLAEDYRAEIRERVVLRCAEAAVSYRVWSEKRETGRVVSRAEVSRMIDKLSHSESSKRLSDSIAELASGKNDATRKWIYDTAFVNCFLAGARAD